MKQKTSKTFVSILALAGLVSACGGGDPLYNQFTSEAGKLITKDVGHATVHNMRVMTDQDYYQRSVAQEFSKKVPDMINFDLNSAELDATAKSVFWMHRPAGLRNSLNCDIAFMVIPI